MEDENKADSYIKVREGIWGKTEQLFKSDKNAKGATLVITSIHLSLRKALLYYSSP